MQCILPSALLRCTDSSILQSKLLLPHAEESHEHRNSLSDSFETLKLSAEWMVDDAYFWPLTGVRSITWMCASGALQMGLFQQSCSERQHQQC